MIFFYISDTRENGEFIVFYIDGYFDGYGLNQSTFQHFSPSKKNGIVVTFKDNSGYFKYISRMDFEGAATVGEYPESTFGKAFVYANSAWDTWILERTDITGFSTVTTRMAVVKLKTGNGWLND